MLLTNDKTLYYNAKDAVATLTIANEFLPEIVEGPFYQTYRHTTDILPPLMYMMIHGVKVNLDALEAMRVKCGKLIIQYQQRLNELCGHPLNPLSPKACKNYFYIEKGIPPYTKRGTGGQGSTITCDDKALQRLARGTSSRKGLEEARIIQRIRQLHKLKGTYLDITLDEDKRMRCSYNPRGTRFGRISSSKTIFETGMNMQNLPPAFQQFLVADDDRIILSLDKARAEWVVVAYASSDASMIKAVEEGIDVHSYTASEMFKVPLGLVYIEHKAVDKESDPEKIAAIRHNIKELEPYLKNWLPRTMSMRQCGKKSNHGLNYDETCKMFSLINEITEKEAQIIIDFYHRIYPGIRRWYETINRRLSTDRTLTNLFGRPYRFLDKWGPDLLKSAYSYIPQSTVGELVNRAMLRIYNDDSVDTKDLELLMQVHDSLDLQMPYNDLGKVVRACRMLERCMDYELTAGGRKFHIGTDLKIGFSFGTLTEVKLSATNEELEANIKRVIDEQKTK